MTYQEPLRKLIAKLEYTLQSIKSDVSQSEEYLALIKKQVSELEQAPKIETPFPHSDSQQTAAPAAGSTQAFEHAINTLFYKIDKLEKDLENAKNTSPAPPKSPLAYPEEGETTLDMMERMRRKIIAKEVLADMYGKMGNTKTTAKDDIDREIEDIFEKAKSQQAVHELKTKMGIPPNKND